MCFLQVFTKSGNKNKYSEKGQAYYSNFRNVLISRYKIIMDVSNRILDKSKISNLTKTLWNGPKNDILPHNSAFWIFEPCSPKQNMCPKCSIQVNPPKKSVVIFWLNWWKKPLRTFKFRFKDKFGHKFLQISFVKTTLISCSANKWQSSAKLWAAYRICSPLQSMINIDKRLNNSSQSLIWLCCN